ncbi:hypothetical protein [Gordonia paraffinivorans]|uniref:hypothetical protein n=1 Tax=Gordonia paraffinivorans TaxID=175628 RepID=UPI001E4EC6D2|nr:hypothetical protein [Gordonia paraffinivorans]
MLTAFGSTGGRVVAICRLATLFHQLLGTPRIHVCLLAFGPQRPAAREWDNKKIGPANGGDCRRE